MFPSTVSIKKTAKSCLSQNYSVTLVSCLFLLFFEVLKISLSVFVGEYTDSFISALLNSFLTLFIGFPLFLGLVRYFSRFADGVTDYPTEVFFYFSSKKNYFKAIKFTVKLLIRLILSALLISLPALILKLFSEPYVYDYLNMPIPLWTPIFSTISGFLFILAAVVFVAVNLKYYLSFYIFVSCDYNQPIKILNFSSIIARRTQTDFIYLLFSMFLYIVLSLFFLPLIFILPFILTVYIIHSKCAVIQYNNTIEELNSPQTFNNAV